MNQEQQEIANWYIVREIAPNVFWLNEPGHVSFYLFRHNGRALLIDSGLGLGTQQGAELFAALGVRSFDVICTHAHCDHVGLNSLADRVFLSRLEWDKYQAQNEINQLSLYYQALKTLKRWPSFEALDGVLPQQAPWQPVGFLEQGQVISFGPWKFEVIAAPGHTVGSLIFFERKTQFIFSGDLVYKGAIYLHLKDSDLHSYSRSIETIIDLIDLHPGTHIWPAHNLIPLPSQYPREVRKTLTSFFNNEISARAKWPQDLLFEEGQIIRQGDVEIVLREAK